MENGLIYNSSNSQTKIRELIDYIEQKKIHENHNFIKTDSFFKLLIYLLSGKYKFVHLFNINLVQASILNFFNKFRKNKYIFSYDNKPDYERAAKFIKGHTILVESQEAVDYFRDNTNYSGQVFLIRPYADSPVFVASGARQLSIKKEILYLYDSEKNSKAHLLIEMMKHLPAEVFLTCVDDRSDQRNHENLIDISKNLKVDSRVKIVGAQSYDFDQNVKDLFMVVFTDKEQSRYDFSCFALSQGLIVLSNASFNHDDIKGWFRLESAAPRALAKKIIELSEDFIEVDSKKARDLISREAKAFKLLDFYISL
jgi:hypothetical protein